MTPSDHFEEGERRSGKIHVVTRKQSSRYDAKDPDPRHRGFPFNASSVNATASSGNETPVWAVAQGMDLRGPSVSPGMILTKVV